MSVDYYFQVFIALVVLGAILYFCYYLALGYRKKVFLGELKLKDRLTLDKGASVVIVEYKTKQYLLSVADKNIALIKEFSLSSD